MTGEEYILSMSYELDSVLGNLLTWFFFTQLCGVTNYPHPTYETTEAHRPENCDWFQVLFLSH